MNLTSRMAPERRNGMKLGTVSLLVVVSLVIVVASAEARCRGGLLPDLQTVVPKHLGIENNHQREEQTGERDRRNAPPCCHRHLPPVTDVSLCTKGNMAGIVVESGEWRNRLQMDTEQAAVLGRRARLGG